MTPVISKNKFFPRENWLILKIISDIFSFTTVLYTNNNFIFKLIIYLLIFLFFTLIFLHRLQDFVFSFYKMFIKFKQMRHRWQLKYRYQALWIRRYTPSCMIKVNCSKNFKIMFRYNRKKILNEIENVSLYHKIWKSCVTKTL